MGCSYPTQHVVLCMWLIDPAWPRLSVKRNNSPRKSKHCHQRGGEGADPALSGASVFWSVKWEWALPHRRADRRSVLKREPGYPTHLKIKLQEFLRDSSKY